ncbi:MAG: hypothetical protein KDB02_14630 [Acidimicrobiales bacterium]|nr:hypothetical protein [Acidimicrobiales bacterium]
MEEYARKGVELLLRSIGSAPEQRMARRLVKDFGGPASPSSGGMADGRGKKVLIVSPRDWAAHVQYEAVIGHALRFRGAEVSFLTCGGGLEICDRANTYEAPPMPCRSCSRYNAESIESHGFPMHTIRAGWELDDPGWPDLDLMPIDALKEAELDGLPLGRLVDIPLKWFLCAADITDDPLGGRTNRAFLRSARRIATGIAAVLDEAKPDLVLILNGLFLFEGIAWALCKERGIDVVTYERAFRQGTLVFHRGVPAGFYDFSAEWAEADRELTTSEEAELDAYLAARRKGSAFDQYWQFQERSFESGSGRIATLFTNLTWDTAVIDRDLAFDDIQEWIMAAINAFSERPQHHLIIRVHPSELHLPGKVTRDSLSGFIHRTFPRLPANVTVLEPDDLTSSYPLMDASDVGLVYTSTTGLELALGGTPVIVAGETHYRGKGFTVDVSSPVDFERALDEALADPTSLPVDVARARRYAHFFFFRAPIPAPGVVEPLPGLARLTIRTLEDLRPGADPSVDRICDGLLRGASFANPDTT